MGGRYRVQRIAAAPTDDDAVTELVERLSKPLPNARTSPVMKIVLLVRFMSNSIVPTDHTNSVE